MISYTLLPCDEILPEEITDYLKEFESFGEFCNVLWRLYELHVNQWLKEIAIDRRTEYVGFFANQRLVGIGRVTPHPNHIANGRIGIAIRPSERGCGYAPVMIRIIEDYCRSIGMKEITACVATDNEKSLKAFEKAGFTPTGEVYEWTCDRVAIELSPCKRL